MKPIIILTQTILLALVFPALVICAFLGVVAWMVVWIAIGVWLFLLAGQIVWSLIFRRRNPHGAEAWMLAERASEAAKKGASALELYDELSALVAQYPGEPGLPGILAYAASRLKWDASRYSAEFNRRLDEDIARHIGGRRG